MICKSTFIKIDEKLYRFVYNFFYFCVFFLKNQVLNVETLQNRGPSIVSEIPAFKKGKIGYSSFGKCSAVQELLFRL